MNFFIFSSLLLIIHSVQTQYFIYFPFISNNIKLNNILNMKKKYFIGETSIHNEIYKIDTVKKESYLTLYICIIVYIVYIIVMNEKRKISRKNI